jgi:hypothetical protein
MRETSPSPVRLDRAHVAPEAPPSRRVLLACEARRLSRRRAVALAVASRCRRISEYSDARRGASDVAARAMRRASSLHIRFHRTLDALVAAGGFDEALQIVREKKW